MLRRIVVPLDGSTLAESVLPHVTALTRPYQAQVLLLHVLEPQRQERNTSTDLFDWQMRKAEAQEYLNNLARRLEQHDLTTQSVLLEGSPAQRIIDYTHSEDADLLVLSSHGRSGLGEWNISGVVQKVIQEAKTSFLLVRAYEGIDRQLAGPQEGYRRIMVPLDGSVRAEYALPLTRAVAEYWNASVFLTHIVSPPVLFSRGPLAPDQLELIDNCVQRNLADARTYLKDMQEQLSVDSELRLSVSANVLGALENVVAQNGIDLMICTAHGQGCHPRHAYGTLVTNCILYGQVATLVIQDLPAEQMELTAAEKAARRLNTEEEPRMPAGTPGFY